MSTKLPRELVKLRSEFKLNLLRTSFIGDYIDNRRSNQRLLMSTIGEVTEKRHFLTAHRNCRILATLKLRDHIRLRAEIAYGGPGVHTDFVAHKTIAEMREYKIAALILNVRDTKLVYEQKAGLHAGKVFGQTLWRNSSMHGILGRIGDAMVYGTDDTNVDTPTSYIVYNLERWYNGQPTKPFRLNWYWSDSLESLGVDCSADLRTPYMAVPLQTTSSENSVIVDEPPLLLA